MPTQCKTERYLVWKGTKVIMKDRIISLHHTGCKNTKKFEKKGMAMAINKNVSLTKWQC